MYLEINVCILRGKIVNVSGLMCQSVSLCQHNTRGEHNFIYGAENIEELHLKHSLKLARGEIPSSAVLYTFRHGSSETHHTAWHHLTAHPPG